MTPTWPVHLISASVASVAAWRTGALVSPKHFISGGKTAEGGPERIFNDWGECESKIRARMFRVHSCNLAFFKDKALAKKANNSSSRGY